MKQPEAIPALEDMKQGDLFWYASRVCTIEEVELKDGEKELFVMSLSDGWSGRLSQQLRGDNPPVRVFKDSFSVIEMPKTPLELLKFVRTYQIKYDERLEQ